MTEFTPEEAEDLWLLALDFKIGDGNAGGIFYQSLFYIEHGTEEGQRRVAALIAKLKAMLPPGSTHAGV